MDLPRLDIASSDADSEPAETLAPIDYLFGAPDQQQPVDAAPREVHYERGSTIYALDGPVGTLRQMVIDEEQAEVKALVVRESAKGEPILVPPELVDRSVGTALFLNVTKEEFALGASRSPRFNARMFTGADARSVAKAIPHVFRGDKRRSLVGLTRDRLVTGEVLDPALPSEPAPQPRWKFVFRNRGR